MRQAGIDLTIRPYDEQDEDAVLDLLREALGEGPTGRRTPAFFRWKHFANPFGTSFMFVAEADGRIVGLRAFMRWEFASGGRLIKAVTAVDTATHPQYQGRGVFSTLTKVALGSLPSDIDLVFNTPNEKSLPGYLKMGWQIVGRVPVNIRVRRPLRFALGVRSIRRSSVVPRRDAPSINGPRAGDVLADDDVISFVKRSSASETRIATRRDGAYLPWRYAQVPTLDYRALRTTRSGRTTGLVIFRVRPRAALWESTISELIVEPRDKATTRELLRQVNRVASVDHLACHFPSRSITAWGTYSSGFLPSMAGVTLVVNPLNRSLDLDATSLSSWALSLGDLEVF
jgi:GNAT superfamily N-acetyltransferase